MSECLATRRRHLRALGPCWLRASLESTLKFSGRTEPYLLRSAASYDRAVGNVGHLETLWRYPGA